MSAPRRLFLVGFMGSGKSVVGRLVAERLGVPLEDTDRSVERTARRTIEEIFRTSGEGCFREMEWRALQSVSEVERVVVATGGGLFLGVVQRRFMKERGAVAWLDAPLEKIRARIGTGDGRPLWTSADRIAQRAFFEKRRAAYALADFRVDASRDPACVASDLLARFRALTPASR